MIIVTGVGIVLAFVVGGFATLSGFERDRAFYPTVLIVVASYYELFALMASEQTVIGAETAVLVAFVAAAVIGFRTSLWVVVAALMAHGLYDFTHALLFINPGTPVWWPAFCLAYDVAAAGYLALRLSRPPRPARVADTAPRPAAGPGDYWLLRRPDHGADTRRVMQAVSGIHRRHRLTVRAVLIILSVTLGSAAGASEATAVRIAHVDGQRIAYRIHGASGPVIVLMSGLGDTMSSFDGVVADLARHATVITYDRGGYGRSTMGPGPRDAAAVERELSGLLEQTGLPGPYILLGHSIGGLYAEYYAARHPDQIAGLILEEARPADFTTVCEREQVSMCVVTPEMMRRSPPGPLAEVVSLAATASRIEAAGRLANRPVLVLSRFPSPRASPFEVLWQREQTGLAARYPGAIHHTAPSGGHYIHRGPRAWFLEEVSGFLTD